MNENDAEYVYCCVMHAVVKVIIAAKLTVSLW
jgi:hypothetical protein